MAISAIGAATLASSAYSAEQGRRQQKKALKSQEAAQRDAEQAAAKQQRDNEMQIARANRKKPNLGALLTSAQQFGGLGLSSTSLTGPLNAPLGGR